MSLPKKAKKPKWDKAPTGGVSKTLKLHSAFTKPKELKKGLKQLKRSPLKGGGKTLSQRLVVKMSFSPAKSKNQADQSDESAESSPEKVTVKKEKKLKGIKGKNKIDAEEIESDKPPAKKRKLSEGTEQESKRVKRTKSVEKQKMERKVSTDNRVLRRTSQDSVDKVKDRKERRKSGDVKEHLERRKSTEKKGEISGRRKSGEKKAETSARRKSADAKSEKASSRRTRVLSRELQVMQNIKANSQSARLRKLQENLLNSAAMEESSDEDISAMVIPAKYDPCVAEQEEEGKNTFQGFTQNSKMLNSKV